MILDFSNFRRLYLKSLRLAELGDEDARESVLGELDALWLTLTRPQQRQVQAMAHWLSDIFARESMATLMEHLPHTVSAVPVRKMTMQLNVMFEKPTVAKTISTSERGVSLQVA